MCCSICYVQVVAQEMRHVYPVIISGLQNFVPHHQGYTDVCAVPPLPHAEQTHLLVLRLPMMSCKIRIRRSAPKRQRHRRTIDKNRNSQPEKNKVQRWNKPKPKHKKAPTDKSASTGSSTTTPITPLTQYPAAAPDPIINPTQRQYELSEDVDDSLLIIAFRRQGSLPTSVAEKRKHVNIRQC